MAESADTEVASPVAIDRRYLDYPAPRPDFEYPLSLTYCGECGLPLEYCEYGATQQRTRCRTWLEKALPDEFARLNTESQAPTAVQGPSQAASTTPAEAEGAAAGSTRQKRGGKGVARKEKEPQASADSEEQPAVVVAATTASITSTSGGKKSQNAASKQRVRISTVPRGKGKFVTAVAGLNSIEKDLKVLAKALGTKMACGASVSNVETGEIIVQGDVAERIKKFLLEKYSTVLSADQIDIAESD